MFCDDCIPLFSFPLFFFSLLKSSSKEGPPTKYPPSLLSSMSLHLLPSFLHGGLHRSSLCHFFPSLLFSLQVSPCSFSCPHLPSLLVLPLAFPPPPSILDSDFCCCKLAFFRYEWRLLCKESCGKVKTKVATLVHSVVTLLTSFILFLSVLGGKKEQFSALFSDDDRSQR